MGNLSCCNLPVRHVKNKKMKLILAIAAATAVAAANLEKEKANQFLKRNKRFIDLESGNFWECDECPWEQAKEHYQNKAYEEFTMFSYGKLKACVWKYKIDYEEFDEKMEAYHVEDETTIEPRAPTWDCKMGDKEINLADFAKDGYNVDRVFN